MVIDILDSPYEDFESVLKPFFYAFKICGFAVLHHIFKPENPFMYVRDFLDIDEFAVDTNHRRQGIASAMITFIRDWAKAQGFKRLELNMWEFNQSALAFYEAAGFETFRRYMEMML
jgi:GNAT superfamily N-acetyltransferase